MREATPLGPLTYGGLTEDQRVGHYVNMWKQSVEVQQHFNDIEWRIRGLALTVATFALGAAGLAVKDHTQVGPISLGALIVLTGLLLWYAFYFVDRAWYHPLLKAAVISGTRIETEIGKSLPEVGITQAITDGSPYTPRKFVQFLSRRRGAMHSDDKLVWFYKIGASALVVAAIALQLSVFFTDPTDDSPRSQRLDRHHKSGAEHHHFGDPTGSGRTPSTVHTSAPGGQHQPSEPSNSPGSAQPTPNP